MKFPVALLLPLLAACSVAPYYEPVEMPMPTKWHAAKEEEVDNRTLGNFLWWEELNDTQLNSLLARAYDQNLDLSIAALRICEARLERQGKAAESLPHVDGSVAGGGAHLGKNCLTDCYHHRTLGYFEAGFDADWELDLFGKTAYEVNALDARVEASEASFCDVWLSLSSEIGRNYIELRALQKRVKLLNDSIEAQRESFKLNQELQSIGMVNTIDLVQENQQLSLLEAQRPAMEMAVDRSIYRLSILLGYAPGDLYDELYEVKPLPALPQQLPMGYPSELLRRRPDIRSAERELAAATEQVGSAVASLFPQISLKGFIGEISPLKGFGGDPTGLLGPQLLMPIFNSKLLTQDVNYNKLKAQEACYRYQSKVLSALEEAEGAIAAFHYEQEHNRRLGELSKSHEEVYTLTLDLFHKGFKDFREVQTAKRAQLNTEDLAIQAQKELLLDFIALYKALGGGF